MLKNKKKKKNEYTIADQPTRARVHLLVKAKDNIKFSENLKKGLVRIFVLNYLHFSPPELLFIITFFYLFFFLGK